MAKNVTIWTCDLEEVKDYYVTYFDGLPNDKYHNKANTKQEVDGKSKILSDTGYKILKGPNTADNFCYEFETLYPVVFN